MTAITIAPRAGIEAVTAAVLSSLPVSYTATAADATADVVVVAGSSDWPSVVDHLLGEGSAAAIVVHPEPADLAALPRTPGLVVIDSVWAGNPAVPAAAGHFGRAATASQLVECRVITGPDRPLGANLLDLAALIRSLIGPLRGVSVLQYDSHGFFATAKAADLSVSLSVVRSSALAPQASVRLLTDDGGVEMVIPDPSTARPAEVMITNGDGLQRLPTVWESSHRAAWRRARTLLDSRATAPDLAMFAEDQSVLDDAVHLLEPQRSTTWPSPDRPTSSPFRSACKPSSSKTRRTGAR